MEEQGEVAAWLTRLTEGSTILAGRAYLPYLNRVRARVSGVLASPAASELGATLEAATTLLERATGEPVAGKRLLEIGSGLGALKDKVWRIGLMGHSARRESVALLLAALRDLLNRQLSLR